MPTSPWGRREKLLQMPTTPWSGQIHFHLKTLFFGILDCQLYNVKMHVYLYELCRLGDAKN